MNWGDAFQRHWKPLTILFWVAASAYLIWDGWGRPGLDGIQGFALGDTDDNLRMMQVRGWVDGSHGWYDLRQYRLSPPDGLSIHWSRLVDLPIVMLWNLAALFTDGPEAETFAVTVAPLLPYLVMMLALGLAARRLLSPHAFWLVLTILVCCGTVRGMVAPLRIDHHGWQLAMLAVALAGLADANKVRGGLTVGIASALSMTIGLEMLLYLALAGVAIGLLWVRDEGEAPRLFAYGAGFAGVGTFGFLVFASNDNWAPVCDALSPVWLSVVLVAGAVAMGLAWLSPRDWPSRLGLATIGGMVLAVFYAVTWPHCLGRLEGVPPELDAMWLSNVREAMPIYRHGTGVMLSIMTIPLIGLIGYLAMIHRYRRHREVQLRWLAIGATALLSVLLLFWQTRAAAAAQLLAVPGAAGLGWALIAWFQRQRNMLVRVLGTAAAFALVSGMAVSEAYGWFQVPEEKTEYAQRIDNANFRCATMTYLAAVDRVPRGQVMTFVDMGPRLVTVTHHDAVAGPYHRNARAILDVMHFFRGSADQAKEIVDRRHIDYVLICPDMSESTIDRADAPDGMYVHLARDEIPDWLEPVPLDGGYTPFKMWRVRR